MGYEITLVIGSILGGGNGDCILTIATVDLCKIGDGPMSTLNAKDQNRDKGKSYFYADDGNTHITKDLYDAPLRVRSPREVIQALEGEKRISEERGETFYRRFDVALAMLKRIEETFIHEAVGVLFFGH